MPPRVSHSALSVALAVCGLIALVAVSGCDKKGRVLDEDWQSQTGSNTSYFSGFVASEGVVGRMGVIIYASVKMLAPVRNSPAASVSAIGALTLENGGSVTLAGTYDTASDSVHLTGGGFDFEGSTAWVNGVPTISGAYTSPGDDGAFAVALRNGFGPHQYCGRLYMAGDSLVGRVAYVVSGIAILGAACFDNEPDPVVLQGELDRTSPKPRLSMAGTSATRNLTMHGAFDEDADLSAGSWTSTGAGGTVSGTWSVAPCP